MTNPVTAIGLAIAKGVAGPVGSKAARRALDWAKGSEAKQLVRLLKKDHPAAESMLLQPDALGELWVFAETGDLDADVLFAGVRPLTDSDDEAWALVEAVRREQWRVVREERRLHFELLQLRAELGGGILKRLDRLLAQRAATVTEARQLPAAVSAFVDRTAELHEAERLLEQRVEGVARILCFSGMPGIGKSTLAIEVARRFMKTFSGGVLYADFRPPDGRVRTRAEVATRLLRDVGVAPEGIVDADDPTALLRSVLADIPVLLVLDNAEREDEVRDLVPANSDSVVIVTSRTPLAGLAHARLRTLTGLKHDDAVELLSEYVGERAIAEPEAASAIADACAGLPLAVSVVGARLRRREHARLDRFAAELDDSLGSVDDVRATIRRSLDAALRAATPLAQRVLMLIAMLELTDLSADAIAATAGVTVPQARAALEELEDRQLLSATGPHQLLAALLRELAATELSEDDLLSAQARRVRWLVDSARPHIEDLEG